MHDIDGDGMISPADITDLQTQFSSESSYMLTFDIMLLSRQIKLKMETVPKKNPKDVARDILLQIQNKQLRKDRALKKNSENTSRMETHAGSSTSSIELLEIISPSGIINLDKTPKNQGSNDPLKQNKSSKKTTSR